MRRQINISFLCIVAIAVISFLVISIHTSRKAMKASATDYTYELIGLINKNIESYIGGMEHISRIVISNADVKSFLTSPDGRESYALRVEEQFRTLKETREDIYNIGIISTDGSYLINDREIQINPGFRMEENLWYKRALQGKETISTSHVQNIIYDQYSWVVTMSKSVVDRQSQEVLGAFFIDLNYRSISSLAEEVNLGQKGYVFIVDGDGEIVYHPKQQLIYSGLWEEELMEADAGDDTCLVYETKDKLYTLIRSEVTGWTVVGVTELEEMLSGTDEMIRMHYFIAVFLIAVAMLLAVLLTNRITFPLRRLQESMKIVETGDFSVEFGKEKVQDEIGDLIHSFQVMIHRIGQLIERSRKEQEEKRKSELNALQAQINPHFLYNTLDSIIWMAEGGETREVIEMTAALARLFRKSISNENELVSIQEEMEYTENYLTIQKMRYRGKLRYSIYVSPDIAHIPIIKLIIQPLVENAIYHGIKYKEGIGVIEIRGFYKDHGILIQVRDDGQGMTEEQITGIFEERSGAGKQSGVGILNIHKRIQLYYGEAYGLRFWSAPGEGTIVSIHIPDQIGGANE